jgi:hypothetical protein
VSRVARPARHLAARLHAGPVCALAAALSVAACEPRHDGERTGQASTDSAAAHGRWSIAVRRRRDGRVVVRNGPVPMLPRGAVTAVPRWRVPGTSFYRIAADGGRLYLFSRAEDSIYVAALPVDGVPRMAGIANPLG